MSLYAQAVAAERAAKIARDMADHEAGIEALRQQLAEATDQIAAAVAACKVKDDALKWARSSLNKAACGTIIQRDLEESCELVEEALAATEPKP